jgi:hypothetical protein
MKDEFNALLPQRQPGFLVDALGVRVEQYFALEKDFPVSGAWGSGQASAWAEQLKSQSPGDEVLLRYGKSNGWLDDRPAAITRTYGKGRITYVGRGMRPTARAGRYSSKTRPDALISACPGLYWGRQQWLSLPRSSKVGECARSIRVRQQSTPMSCS